MKKKILLIAMLFAVLVSYAKVPKLKHRVTDNANILSSSQENELEKLLMSIESKTSAQLALLIVNSTNGVPIESYSIEVVEEWKLGQKGRDNGVLLLVALDDKKVRIEVG